MSPISILLIAEMERAQLLMVAGFLMLGWVLARRQLSMRKRVNRNTRAAKNALREMRDRKDPQVPLGDAPRDVQRWQVAMFDLQRELKADLDTRIAIVQTLVRQADERIAQLKRLETDEAVGSSFASATAVALSPHQQSRMTELLRSGRTAAEIADEMGLSLGDVELIASTIAK